MSSQKSAAPQVAKSVVVGSEERREDMLERTSAGKLGTGDHDGPDSPSWLINSRS